MVEQALEDAAPAAEQAVAPVRRGSRNGPDGVTCTRSSAVALSVASSAISEPPSRCTSNSNERLPTICSNSPAPVPARHGGRGRPRRAGPDSARPKRRACGDGARARPRRRQRRTRPRQQRLPARPGARCRHARSAGRPAPACVLRICGGPLSTGSASTSSISPPMPASCGAAGCSGSLTRRSVEAEPQTAATAPARRPGSA